jgi:hypothetical protein
MTSSLAAARELADKVRFVGDKRQTPCWTPGDESKRPVAELFYHRGIEISPALTPSLARRLSSVCDRLKIPDNAVNAFIHSGYELQAACFLEDCDRCVLQFSLTLIDLLDEDEFEFVVGHELGHFLLRHLAELRDDDSAEHFILRRSQEISADRVGLHACASLDTSLRALMKTVSGLTNRHLRFDIGAFISQLKKVDSGSSADQSTSTHPSMLIRSKALLWYSMSDFSKRGEGFYSLDQIRDIDARIERDLTRFVDGAAKLQIRRIKEDLLLWKLAYEIVQRGSFSAKIENEMRKCFDEEIVVKLRSFLTSSSPQEMDALVYERIADVRQKLETLIPMSFMAEINELDAVVTRMVAD